MFARPLIVSLALLLSLSGCSVFSSSSQRSPSAVSTKTVKLSLARKYIGHLLWPVPHGSISSQFGQRWSNFHEGLDIRAPEGTPIYAAHAGKVVYSDDGIRGYGNVVAIQGDGLMTVYGHNRRNIVEVGDQVQAGDQIAELGQTGKATGPHLHFETRVKDSSGRNAAVDPLVFFPARAARLNSN
ncbi:MAG: M23 family metallopeptidase [Deltaproteobacteria bacterium]|nr:M23 family metallopeptidase [Deltaproteobacteria bacterium]